MIQKVGDSKVRRLIQLGNRYSFCRSYFVTFRNPFTWVTEGGDLGTADWGCLALAAAPACVCRLHTVAMKQAALVSDESALEACLRRCAIQIDDLYLYLYFSAQAPALGPAFRQNTDSTVEEILIWVFQPAICYADYEGYQQICSLI